MSKPVRKLNYEYAKKALDELKINPKNKRAYLIALEMAEKEKTNIQFWESQLLKHKELLNEIETLEKRIEKGNNLLKNNLVMSPEFASRCASGVDQLEEKKDSLLKELKVFNEYIEYLNLFTAYKQYSNYFTTQKTMELITQ